MSCAEDRACVRHVQNPRISNQPFFDLHVRALRGLIARTISGRAPSTEWNGYSPFSLVFDLLFLLPLFFSFFPSFLSCAKSDGLNAAQVRTLQGDNMSALPAFLSFEVGSSYYYTESEFGKRRVIQSLQGT